MLVWLAAAFIRFVVWGTITLLCVSILLIYRYVFGLHKPIIPSIIDWWSNHSGKKKKEEVNHL
jgi:hypothetical protein